MIDILFQIGISKGIIFLGLAVAAWEVGRAGNEWSKGALEAAPLNGNERS